MLGYVFLRYIKNQFQKVNSKSYLLLLGFSIIVMFILIFTYKKKKVTMHELIANEFLIVYTVFVLLSTVFCRERISDYQIQLIPFWSWIEAINGKHMLRFEIMLNVVMWIPFGALLPICIRRYFKNRVIISVIIYFFLVLGIEGLQFILKRGLCESDDIINGFIGFNIGILIFQFLKKNCKYK